MITIPILANFLSINSKDVDDISSIVRDDGNYITIKLKKKECSCPSCYSSHYKSKGFVKRNIKHALFLGKATTFLLICRRYTCLECGKTFTESNQFAPKKSKTSYETIRIVLDAASRYNNTWKEIGEKAHISDMSAINIFDRYVNLPRGTFPRVVSIDECYNKHQFSKAYSCIFFDFLGRKIIDVVEDRSKLHLSNYLSKIKREERENVQYVVIDMWEPYLDIASIYFPNATIAIDSFHVLKDIGFALSQVRRRIMKGFPTKTKEYYLLKKWNFVLFNEYPIWEEKFKVKGLGNRHYNCYQLQQMIISTNEELRIAHEFYIRYKRMNKLTNIESAPSMIDSFINDKEIIVVEEFRTVITMLINWRTWIINSFNIVENRRLSNGPIEGFNSNFKKMMTVSNGLYSFQRFRNRLMFCYNKPNCFAPVKVRIPKRPRGKRGPYKKPKNANS